LSLLTSSIKVLKAVSVPGRTFRPLLYKETVPAVTHHISCPCDAARQAISEGVEKGTWRRRELL